MWFMLRMMGPKYFDAMPTWTKKGKMRKKVTARVCKKGELDAQKRITLMGSFSGLDNGAHVALRLSPLFAVSLCESFSARVKFFIS